MKKPEEKQPEEQQPQEIGSYIRNTDGTLKPNENDQAMAERLKEKKIAEEAEAPASAEEGGKSNAGK